MTILVGQMVFAKCGRDRGKAFIVLNICKDYLYLVDGKGRTLQAPKKKKAKHVQPTGNVADLKTDGRALQDADIRKHLKAFGNA
ncbi:MAG: KOW domain-containing RNA-binding protein [Defluviitaleaceae bacterium]|nr:KOW domain-containing RNA-binding protein [Defluviitaleaceae bacterium]